MIIRTVFANTNIKLLAYIRFYNNYVSILTNSLVTMKSFKIEGSIPHIEEMKVKLSNQSKKQ